MRCGTLAQIKHSAIRLDSSCSAKECDVMTTSTTKVLPSSRLSLKDRLSRLTFPEACKLLGPEGQQLIQRHANTWEFKLSEDVFLGSDLFRLRFPDESADDTPL